MCPHHINHWRIFPLMHFTYNRWIKDEILSCAESLSQILLMKDGRINETCSCFPVFSGRYFESEYKQFLQNIWIASQWTNEMTAPISIETIFNTNRTGNGRPTETLQRISHKFVESDEKSKHKYNFSCNSNCLFFLLNVGRNLKQQYKQPISCLYNAN